MARSLPLVAPNLVAGTPVMDLQALDQGLHRDLLSLLNRAGDWQVQSS